MSKTHPLLANILSLASAETWHGSFDLSTEKIGHWILREAGSSFSQVYFVGCGTSLYAGQVGKYIIEGVAHISAEAIPGFSFAHYADKNLFGPHTLVIGISATGGTQAVADSLTLARQAGAPTLALTADGSSKVTQAAEATVLVRGPLTTAITIRTYVQTLLAIYSLALHLVGQSGTVEYWQRQISQASEIAQLLLENQSSQIKQLARQYTQATNIFFLGTGPNIGTAEEASLKTIEMAKIFSDTQELENFFHGRLREVDSHTPIFFFAPAGLSSERILDFLTVTDYVGAPSIVLTNEITPPIQKLATHLIHLPGILDELATPLLYIVPLYLFAYYLAEYRGYDPGARRYPNIIPQNVRYGDVLKRIGNNDF